MATKLTENISQYRYNQFGSNSIFINRWSPRAMTGEPVPRKDFMAMLEAAHWAPSAYNNQHWRFIYVFKDDPKWEEFFSLLAEPNKVWCKNAGVLIVIASKTTFNHNGKPSRTHAYDTGAAWGMLALEGANRGLVVHGMQGFDYNRAKIELEIPDGFEVQAMAAVGILADPETLDEKLRQNEKPSSRKELSKVSAQVKFTNELL